MSIDREWVGATRMALSDRKKAPRKLGMVLDRGVFSMYLGSHLSIGWIFVLSCQYAASTDPRFHAALQKQSKSA